MKVAKVGAEYRFKWRLLQSSGWVREWQLHAPSDILLNYFGLFF